MTKLPVAPIGYVGARRIPRFSFQSAAGRIRGFRWTGNALFGGASALRLLEFGLIQCWKSSNNEQKLERQLLWLR